MKIKLIILALLLAAILPTIYPFLNSGFFTVHDDTQVARVVIMGRALREGQFPVRIVNGLGYGYGYPIFNFYAPLPYYAGGLLYMFGLDALTSTKLMFVIGIIASVLVMGFVLYREMDLLSAIVGAVFYGYVPYKAVQIFVRGSVGEFWVLIFLPLLYYAILSGSRVQEKRNSWVWGGLAFAGIILSHTVLGYVTAVSLAVVITGVLIVGRFGKTARALALHIGQIMLLGLGVSACFWMPAALEIGYTRVAGFLWDQTKYWEHYICPQQFWDSAWGYGGSAPGCIDGMSFKLGKLHIVGILISLMTFFVWRRKSNQRDVRIYVVSISGLVILIYLMTVYSRPIWDALPYSAYIQYPWRLLTYAAFFSSLVCAFGIRFVKPSAVRALLAAVMVVACVYINYDHFHPQKFSYRLPTEYESESELRFRASRISDEYLPKDLVRPEGQNDLFHDTIISTDSLVIDAEQETAIYGKYLYKNKITQSVRINKAYFPGWHYYVNGHEVMPNIINSLPFINLAQGDGTIELKFKDTGIRKIANLITIIFLAFLIIKYGQKTVY